MRERHVRNRLDFLHFKNPKIGLPLVESIQRGVVRTEVCGQTVPYVPLSHPFVERLIGTLRRECLDRTLFWTTTDLEAKLLDFQHYYK